MSSQNNNLTGQAVNSDLSDPEWGEECPLIYQMSYCSVLKQQMTDAEVDELVGIAKRKNAAINITGVLMIENGLVIQWLEGRKSDIRALWAKLLADTRHHCIVELTHREFIDERLFPDWSMHRTSREEMLAIVHSARDLANRGEPTPWAGAIATLCILIDPTYVNTYANALVTNTAQDTK